MDTPPVVHPPPDIHPFRQRPSKGVLLLVFIALLALSGMAWFVTKNTPLHKVNVSALPTETPAAIPSPSTTPRPTTASTRIVITPFPLQDLNKNSLTKTIENNSFPKIIAEQADISPGSKPLLAFFGHNENWNVFGVYLIDLKTFAISPVYEKNENIGGRGGYYMDNSMLEFSPSGQAFYMNRTGINFPSFIIADMSGKILFNSENMGNDSVGHATWVSGNRLVYFDKDTVYIYDTEKRASSATKLPKSIFHLRANPKGTRVAAFTQAKNPLDCETFDLHVYSFPEGTQLTVEPNTLIPAQWKNDTTVGFKKVTGCTKNTEESMFPYSPEIAEKTLEVQ